MGAGGAINEVEVLYSAVSTRGLMYRENGTVAR